MTRADIKCENSGNLLHELKNELIPDPDCDDLAVIPNRWPRTAFHSLMVTRTLRPHTLTMDLLDVELRWVSYGTIVEFHKFGRILDHFHFHIFPPESAPIARARESFESAGRSGDLSYGALAKYPVPHLEFVSTSLDVLREAVLKITEQLDQRGYWFSQVIIPRPNNTIPVVVLFIRTQPSVDMGFAFNLIGLVRTPHPVAEDEAIAKVRMAHWHGEKLELFRAQLIAHWQSTSK